MPLKRLLELGEEIKVLKNIIYYREIKIFPYNQTIICGYIFILIYF